MAVPRMSSPHPSTAPTPVTLERIRNRINEIAPGDLYEAAPDGLVIPTSIGMILIRIDGPLLRITATWAPPVPSGLVSALKVELSVRNAGQPLLAASLFPVDMFGGHQVVGAATIPIAHGMNDDQLFFCIDSHVDYCESFFEEFEQRFPESRFDEEVALIEAEQAAEDAAAHEAGEQRSIADDDPEFMEIIQNLGPLGPAEITHQLAELARSRIADDPQDALSVLDSARDLALDEGISLAEVNEVRRDILLRLAEDPGSQEDAPALRAIAAALDASLAELGASGSGGEGMVETAAPGGAVSGRLPDVNPARLADALGSLGRTVTLGGDDVLMASGDRSITWSVQDDDTLVVHAEWPVVVSEELGWAFSVANEWNQADMIVPAHVTARDPEAVDLDDLLLAAHGEWCYPLGLTDEQLAANLGLICDDIDRLHEFLLTRGVI